MSLVGAEMSHLRPPNIDPSRPLSGQISLTSSGHLIAAFGSVIMSALSDDPERPLRSAEQR